MSRFEPCKGEEMFSCSSCGQKHLVRHRRRVKTPTGRSTSVCEFCVVYKSLELIEGEQPCGTEA